jgi:hypothetical protein
MPPLHALYLPASCAERAEVDVEAVYGLTTPPRDVRDPDARHTRSACSTSQPHHVPPYPFTLLALLPRPVGNSYKGFLFTKPSAQTLPGEPSPFLIPVQ